MRETIFANHHFYHVYNRGVDKRQIFMDKNDYYRFVFNLFELNDINSSGHLQRHIESGQSSALTTLRESMDRPVELEKDRFQIPILRIGARNKTKEKRTNKRREPRKLLAKILCFCLMPNHFHLLLEQIRDNGISKFMHKLGTAYTKYFNTRYERSGHLFQGAFKVVSVENEAQLLHLSRYLHINPVELVEPGWKEKGIKNWKKVNEFLEKYRWSSYLDYIGKKNFPSVTDRELISSYFKNSKDYKKFINDWLIKDLKEVDELALED